VYGEYVSVMQHANEATKKLIKLIKLVLPIMKFMCYFSMLNFMLMAEFE
jgi:hypothetical protein